MVRDLLAGELHGWPDGTVPGSGWPERVLPAIGLPGFAAELRELLLRAAERGLGPEELQKLGEQQDVPEWVAAGRFFRTYEQVVLLRGAAGRGAPQATAPALDAAELVGAALDALASDPELLAAERARVQHLSSTTRRTSTRSRWSWYGVLGDTARTACWRATRTSRCSASAAPTQTAWTRSRRRRPCSGRPPGRRRDPRRRGAGRRAGLPGSGPGRERRGPRAGQRR